MVKKAAFFMLTCLSLMNLAAGEKQGPNGLYQDNVAQQKMQVALGNMSLASGDSQQLNLLTINLGLLDGVFAKVPLYKERSAAFIQTLETFSAANDLDVIFIQELWYREDYSRLRSWAASHGYESVNSQIKASLPPIPLSGRGTMQTLKYLEFKKQNPHLAYNQDNTGLEILVKKSLIKTVKYVGFNAYNDHQGNNRRALFETIAFLDPGFHTDVIRGTLNTVIELQSGKTVGLYTTHLTPLISNTQLREYQLFDLGMFMKNRDREMKVDYDIIGADFNFSPTWENAIGNDIDGEASDWDKNADNYTYFSQFVQLVDTYAVTNSIPGYTQDRTANPITAVSGSTITEPEQRIDYLLIGATSRMKGFNVLESQLVFTEPIDGKDLFLTDHLGVMSKVLIGR